MKKGLMTFDMLIAIIAILLLFAWLQNLNILNINNSKEFGSETQVKGAALSVGSQINAFYAINPTSTDYLDFSLSNSLSNVSIFGESGNIFIVEKLDTKLIVDLFIQTIKYESIYPVIKDLHYDKTANKVGV